MSQHGCPERLSNRSKGFQEESAGQATMEVLVETLTGTAFEMTVSPSDTIFAIKSKIFRVEGIPVSQQHLVYNLKELDDGASLSALGIGDGARLRLVLGMRGGPISTRRLPPPPSDISGELERLLGTNRYRESSGWGGGGGGSGGGSRSGCKVTVLVFRDGERVNMLRVRENRDGSLQPLDHAKYSSTPPEARTEARGASPGAGARENAVTHSKMQELRRRMQALSLRRPKNDPLPELQKTRSEESLCGRPRACACAAFGEAGAGSAPRCAAALAGDADRYALLPPIVSGSRAPSPQSAERAALALLPAAPPALLPPALLPPIGGLSRGGARAFGSSSALCAVRGAGADGLARGAGAGGGGGGAGAGGAGVALAALPCPLGAALSALSASTSHLEALRRNMAPLSLSRHRVREHLHLSDERLAPAAPAPPAPAAPPAPPAKPLRLRCALCRRRLSVAAAHTCGCGAAFCAPHRYAEAHGCGLRYKPDAPDL